MNPNAKYYIGIDVGTGSVRAALVNQSGILIASSIHKIKTWRDPNDHRIFEQSTKDIWNAVGSTINACLLKSGVIPEDVKGLGFDATCSLAVTNFNGEPVVVTKGEQIGEYGDRNVVLWADHRAEKEAELINATGSIVLDYVGGKMSVSLHYSVPQLRHLN
jgi:ribulose kinase